MIYMTMRLLGFKKNNKKKQAILICLPRVYCVNVIFLFLWLIGKIICKISVMKITTNAV